MVIWPEQRLPSSQQGRATSNRWLRVGREMQRSFLKLKEEPDRFLATIQIGITGVGVLASAVGGAAAVKVIKPVLQAVPVKAISLAAEPIAIGIVVVVITYFSVIFGELVPKSIALMHPETIGLWTARTH